MSSTTDNTIDDYHHDYRITTTYVLSFASTVCLAFIVLTLLYVVVKMNSLYTKVTTTVEAAAGDKKVATTPASADAMEDGGITVTFTSKLPLHSKLAHGLAATVSVVIVLFVGCVLADGTSVIKVKDPKELPIVTAAAVKADGFDYRVDQLLGPSYGVGLHHDQAGFTWSDVHAGKTLRELIRDLGLPVVSAAVPSVIATDDLKHPVAFLECNHLKTAGLTAVSFGFIAETAAFLMMIFHTLVLVGAVPAKLVKPIGGLVWATLSAGFLIVVGLAVGIYTAEWECDNIVIPSITLSDHFDYNYGFTFAILGFVSSILVLFTLVFITSMNDGTPSAPALSSAKMSVAKVLGAVSSGMVVCGLMCIIILGGNGSYDDVKKDNSNPCAGQQRYHAGPGDNYFSNTDCEYDSIVQTLEQAGANVTLGFQGGLDTGDRTPITGSYADQGLCPVNVHWHLGAEHLSVGQYDEHGTSPSFGAGGHHRELAAGASIREGFQCHYYDEADSRFDDTYEWQYCTDMHVGETYEVHWPHSAAGACGTEWQMQTPFYDGVFCRDGIITIAPLNTYEKIGVQAQVFTVINDESFYYDSMFEGMLMDDRVGGMGQDITKYTGSTTGTSRNNEVCSRYTPITWQVDRNCHLISASSFDEMCRRMIEQSDDMSDDLYPHGARELVAAHLSADNQVFHRRGLVKNTK